MKQQPYLWTREHARERLENIDSLRHVIEDLYGEPGDRGHYARYQWLGNRHEDVRRETLRTPTLWNGISSPLHLRVISSCVWFVREVYQRALARTHARYPGFDEHHYADGTRIGERLLSFNSETYDLAASYLWNSLWKVMEDEKPTVREYLIESPCSNWGYSPVVAQTKRHGHEMNGTRCLTLIRHVDKVQDGDINLFKMQIDRGEQPVLDETPKSWAWDQIADGFIELSAPELAFLNWADSRKPLSAADVAMHRAVADLDGTALKTALAGGADVNNVSESGESSMTTLVRAWAAHRHITGLGDDGLRKSGWARPACTATRAQALAVMDVLLAAGAHPDIHVPNECHPLNQAALDSECEMGERLLAAGASASLSVYSDSSRGEWSQTWESPYFDAHYEDCERAKAFLTLLEKTRPTPYYEPDPAKL